MAERPYAPTPRCNDFNLAASTGRSGSFVACYNPPAQEIIPWKYLACLALLLAVSAAQTSASQAPVPSAEKRQVLWQKLGSAIHDVDQHLDGVAGIAIEDLTTGDHFFLHAN